MSSPSDRRVWRHAVLVWACAIAVVGAWAVVHQRGVGRSRSVDQDALSQRGGFTPVFVGSGLPIERVDRVELRRRNGHVVFERRDDGWRQQEPFDQPADGAQIRNMLVRAADLRAGRRVAAESVDLASLGLAPAQAELTLSFDGESHRLQLGRRGVGGRAWLRLDDGPALAVDPSLHDALLEGDPRRWRSWRLFDLVGTESDRLVFDRTPADPARPPQRFALEKRGARWHMTEPFRTRVDQATVEALLGALARVEHAGFVEDDPKDLALFGLERPIASVEVHSIRRGNDRTPVVERLEIGSALAQGGSICARRMDRPPIMLLEQTTLAALVPSPAAFVDPRPCGVLPEDIRRVRMRDGQGTLTVELERTLDGWMVVDGDGAKVPARAAAIGLLFDRLCVARAQELALQPMPPELLVATIELTPTSGPPVIVRVGREGEAGKWALDESDDVLRIFPPSLELPLDRSAFLGQR